ncbi:MAG: Hsp33 family molecular chaperone HslO [Lachnospiraceae bacterium]|nr:Hsp33 family molecular chaperone HslO [Lachnospiraceae bacterium]
MSDYIIRGTAAGDQVRFFAATTRELVETAREIHNTSPIATAALGRLLTAGAMMGSMSKSEEDLTTLRIKCNGPIGSLMVTADGAANVKGYVGNPNVILPANSKGKLDVAGALDLGVLSVIKDIGLKEPYVGQTQLVSGEIAEDLTYYFATSEQVPTSVALGVLMNHENTVQQAGGFIIQLMPFAEESLIDSLEERLKNYTSITTLLDQGKSPEDIMKDIFQGYDLRIMDQIPTTYRCNCSRDRVERAVRSISRKDIEEMIADNQPIEVNCHFCNKHYVFDVDDLKNMLK